MKSWIDEKLENRDDELMDKIHARNGDKNEENILDQFDLPSSLSSQCSSGKQDVLGNGINGRGR